MIKRFLIPLIGMMVLVCGLSSNSFCMTISQLRKDLAAKFTRFDSVVKDMTMVIEGKVSQDKREMGTTESKIFRKGLKLRIENRVKVAVKEGEMEEMTVVMVYDGKDAWMIDPVGQVMKIEDIPEEHMDPARFVPEGAVLQGEEKIDGRPCYVVSYSSEPKIECRLWLDKERLVPLKMETGEVIVLFKDYKQIAGIWGMPYTTTATGGPQEMVSRVKSLVINTGLSDGLFKVEAGESRSMEELMKMYQGK